MAVSKKAHAGAKKTAQHLEDQKINAAFSENAVKMMKKRYLAKDAKGNQETPAQMFRRIAHATAGAENNYGKDSHTIAKIEKDFFEIMTNKEFTPAGRTITNAGGETRVVANCIVLPVKDSMESIFQTLKDAALLQQAGAGLGFDFSHLRPAYSPTKTSKGVASGPVSFLRVYDSAFGVIKQQGRHGANMAMMRVDHPDVLDFVKSKAVEGDIRNFNITVNVTDEFMKALVERPNTQWYATWNGTKMKPHKILRAPNGSVKGSEELTITVKELFDEIVHYAWLNGEPGIGFIDTVNRTNPLPGLGLIDASNPCGEQYLHHYDVCNLGSINLAKFIKPLPAKTKQPLKFTDRIDWKRMDFVTKTSTRLLDNVIDLFDYPVEAVNEMAKKNRRIGLGLMGFADMLYQLGIKYNSQEGLEVAEAVMQRIEKISHETSKALAREKGEFPNYPLSVFAKKKIKMRNAALTTVAPTGSISMMFDASSGIEPNFALAYIKQDKDGQRYHYLNTYLEAELKKRKLYTDALVKEIIEKGTIQHITELPQDIRDTFVVSMDLSGEDHIRMQAAFQKYVDNSISKTINFPNSATKEDVVNGYIMAWKLGCKSTTVYRDGSRVIQILNIGTGENIIAPTEAPIKKADPIPLNIPTDKGKIEPRIRSEVISGRTYRVKTGYGNLYVTINDDETGAPFEVFATIGKSGGFFQEQSEGICRLISLALRSGIKVETIIEQIKGIRGPMPVMTDKGTILSLPDAIGQILLEHVKSKASYTTANAPLVNELAAVQQEKTAQEHSAPHYAPKQAIADFGMMPGCPDCGSPLKLAEGCMSCPTCGFSRCT